VVKKKLPKKKKKGIENSALSLVGCLLCWREGEERGIKGAVPY